MTTITIEPATADRFDDAQHALSGGGDGYGCQCQWWMMPSKEWQTTSREQREGMLRDEIDGGPSPALIAYVDGEAAGWVRVGPRTRQIRLARTRNYAAHSEEPWDDDVGLGGELLRRPPGASQAGSQCAPARRRDRRTPARAARV